VDGCDTAFDCVGLPMEAIGDHPVIARKVADAARQAQCRLVQVSSFWAYLPVVRLPLDENHPRSGGPFPVRVRREAEDILQDAGAAIVHLPDFYGPEVHTSTLQNALADAVRGRPVGWVGSPHLSRDYVFVPDAMDTVARLAEKDAAYGQRWIIPGAGPVSLTRLLGIVARHLGSAPRVRAASPWLLRVLSIFNRPLRQFLPMVPHYAGSISYTGAKLQALLGKTQVPPYERGIPATLDWLRDALRPGVP
jgi:nucleoside-diphosphate-sugar epimerase